MSALTRRFARGYTSITFANLRVNIGKQRESHLSYKRFHHVNAWASHIARTKRERRAQHAAKSPG